MTDPNTIPSSGPADADPKGRTPLEGAQRFQGYTIRVVERGHEVHRNIATECDDGGVCIEQVTLTVEDDSAVVDGGDLYVTRRTYDAMAAGEVEPDLPQMGV